ncbi:hypothetical protein [Streptomyces boluensis]|uniref:Uncharacterized protein n=1 Tax=Streptomyces boluensis TaxID=1775135 RepID=A0A964USS6_9ACTN|nr:hypothetical protein [Streptomyces boluensis]NBE54768.1 hypothetical protein [Streptomyces boluensis]
MSIDIPSLMEDLAGTGASVLLKCDGERIEQNLGAWTFVVTGGPLAEGGPVRRDDSTLNACLAYGLRLLRERGEEWHWVDRYLAG